MNRGQDADLDRSRQRLKALLEAKSNIESPTEETSRSKTLKISSEGAGTPLFCVHGGAAGVASYTRLASVGALNRPVFGLQTVSPSVDDPALRSIERLADLHFAEIQATYPEGPLMLAGHSMAAIVARRQE